MSEEPKPEVVVRLKTTAFRTSRGFRFCTDLILLKRKCQGFDFLTEECLMIGADEAIRKITNLGECEDGIYRVVLTNIQHDWESGHVDDYDFMLVPWKEELPDSTDTGSLPLQSPPIKPKSL